MLPFSDLPSFLLDAARVAWHLFQKYVFDDWNFLGFLIVAMIIDTATGVSASLVARSHNSRQMRQLFRKLNEYGAALVLLHLLCSIEVDGQKLQHIIFAYGRVGLKYFVYTSLIWTEVKSVDENLRRSGGNGLPFPPWLRQRFDDLAERGPEALQSPATTPDALPPAAEPAADPLLSPNPSQP